MFTATELKQWSLEKQKKGKSCLKGKYGKQWTSVIHVAKSTEITPQQSTMSLWAKLQWQTDKQQTECDRF